MADTAMLREQIVSTALALGERASWEQVTLHDVADELGITLDQIRVYFPQKDDIVEAWFDRADSAMLKAAATRVASIVLSSWCQCRLRPGKRAGQHRQSAARVGRSPKVLDPDRRA